MPRIPLCAPSFDDTELLHLQECVLSTYVSSTGPFVSRFENEFAEYVGSPFAIACASGTAAIHVALRCLGVGPGDVVLVSDFTFIASANPVLYQGAEPMFIDSETRSWNMDPGLLEKAIVELEKEGRRPKAVIVVHIFGQPADMGPIVEICENHSIPIIEDAAESLGASYGPCYSDERLRNRSTGTIGILGCFSFNGNKVITTGGGGMITTADPALAKRAKHLTTQAKLPGPAFIHDDVGYNYRLTNLAASLGLAQFAKLGAFLRRKREISTRYRKLALEFGWAYQPQLNGTVRNDWFPAISIPEGRDSLCNFLNSRDIETRPVWLPVTEQQPYSGSRRWSNNVGPTLARTSLCLPCSTGLSDSDLDLVISSITEWAHNHN